MGAIASVGVPSTRTLRDAAGDFGVGAMGGMIYSLSRSLFGSGFIGAIIATIIAGSMVKGVRGTALAAVAGFIAFSTLFSAGFPTSVASAGETLQDAVM